MMWVLMSESEYAHWQALPDEVTVYRGVGATGTREGLSWTESIQTAKWFKKRYSSGKRSGYVLKVTIRKENCLCCFDRREEEEVIIDINAVKDQVKVL